MDLSRGAESEQFRSIPSVLCSYGISRSGKGRQPSNRPDADPVPPGSCKRVHPAQWWQFHGLAIMHQVVSADGLQRTKLLVHHDWPATSMR